jgi:hypothetical protein
MARSDLQAVSCTIFAYLHIVHVREGDHALHMLTIICIFLHHFFSFKHALMHIFSVFFEVCEMLLKNILQTSVLSKGRPSKLDIF